MLLTRRFVEVPIRVQTPPAWEANDMGMSSFDGASFPAAAAARTIGSITATTPVLLMKAEEAPTMTMVRTSRAVGLFPYRMITRPATFTAPVRCRPTLKTNMQATVVAGLLNPETASSGVTSRKTTNTPRTIRATRSMENRSITNSTTAPTRMASTKMIVITTFPTSDVRLNGRVPRNPFAGSSQESRWISIQDRPDEGKNQSGGFS